MILLANSLSLSKLLERGRGSYKVEVIEIKKGSCGIHPPSEAGEGEGSEERKIFVEKENKRQGSGGE